MFHRQIQPALGKAQKLRVNFEVRQVGFSVKATAALRNESVFAELLGRNDFDGKGFELESFFRVADAPGDVHRFVWTVQVNCDRRRKSNKAEKSVTC